MLELLGRAPPILNPSLLLYLICTCPHFVHPYPFPFVYGWVASGLCIFTLTSILIWHLWVEVKHTFKSGFMQREAFVWIKGGREMCK